MVGTPPRVTGTKDQQQWFQWAEGLFRTTELDLETARMQIRATEQTTTTQAKQSSEVITAVGDTGKIVTEAGPTNRVPADLTNAGFWQKVIAGTRPLLSANFKPNIRNATASSQGLLLAPTDKEGASIDITAPLRVPPSKKVHVSATADGLVNFRVRWYDVADNLFNETILAKGNAMAPSGAAKYTVALELPGGDGSTPTSVMVSKAQVFEVIGSGGANSFEIGPDGYIVYDENGNPKLAVQPNMPPPEEPSAPILTTGLGTVSAAWDGKLGSADPSASFYLVYAERGTSETGPWARIGQPLMGKGSVSVAETVGATVWYRFTAQDNMGRVSEPGEASSIVVAGVDAGDISDDFRDQVEEALDNSNLALSSIGGVVTWNSATPVAADGVGKLPGALWWKHTAGVVTGLYEWDGTAWGARGMDDSMLLSLDAAKITAGILDAARIAAGSIVTDKLAASAVTAEKLAVGAVIAEKIAAEAIEANHISAGAIEVNHLSPSVGENLDLSANGSINLIVEAQDAMQTGITDAAEAAEDARLKALASGSSAAQASAAAEVARKAAVAAQGTANGANTKVNTVMTHFWVDAEGAHVGKSDSAFQTHVKDDRFEITENGIVQTYWSAGVMNVPSAVISEVVLANHKIENYGSGTVIRAL